MGKYAVIYTKDNQSITETFSTNEQALQRYYQITKNGSYDEIRIEMLQENSSQLLVE